MHGRVKVKTSAEKAEEKRRERDAKAKMFQGGMNVAFNKRLSGGYDEEALSITSRLLAANPDVITLWNFRREVLLKLNKPDANETTSNMVVDNVDDNAKEAESCDDKIEQHPTVSESSFNHFQKLCENELELTAVCLTKNPKSYCSWHQRSWVMDIMPEPNLKKEIGLCNQFLDMDERNFLCWDYRRIACKRAKMDILEEIDYTLTKIQQNFSNFSSWYYRSCLYTEASLKNMVNFDDIWEKEYDLVENAIFTDPSDQSAWFYHRWLANINLGKNINTGLNKCFNNQVAVIKAVFDRDSSRMFILLSKAVRCFPENTVASVAEDGSSSWQRETMLPIGQDLSSLWTLNCENVSKLSIGPHETVLDLNADGNVLVWEKQVQTNNRVFILKDKNVADLKTLQQMEPDNKWVNLTMSLITSDDQMDTVKNLTKLDPLRTNYYRDQESKITLESRLKSWRNCLDVDLGSLRLTSLYFLDALIHVKFLDISRNELTRLGKSLNLMVCLEVLIADDNKISTIQSGLQLESLRILSLKFNKLKVECLSNLANCKRLSKVVIHGNPAADDLVQLNDPAGTICVTDAEELAGLSSSFKGHKVHYF